MNNIYGFDRFRTTWGVRFGCRKIIDMFFERRVNVLVDVKTATWFFECKSVWVADRELKFGMDMRY
jgi:hypothetical protein